MGFILVDIRTTFIQYLKMFLKKIKIPFVPVDFCQLMLPPNDNFLRMVYTGLFLNFTRFHFYAVN